MAVGPVEVRRFGVLDAEEFRAIRLAALKGAPEAFGSTYQVEVARPLADFTDRLATSTVFGAYVAGKIVGMAAFKQESGRKDAHKGFLWGTYVQPDARCHGVGTALIEAVFQSASQMVEQLTLTVVQGNDAAIALYKTLGFGVYGVEPRALKTCAGYLERLAEPGT